MSDGSVRNTHLKARMYLEKEAFGSSCIHMECKDKKDMKADAMSNSLDPGDHCHFAKFMQGCIKLSDNGCMLDKIKSSQCQLV